MVSQGVMGECQSDEREVVFMHSIRQVVVILLFVLIMTGSLSIVQARIIDHVPVILPSVDAAVARLNQLSLKTDRNNMYLHDGSIAFASIRRVSLQNTGLGNTTIWIDLTGGDIKFISSKDAGFAAIVADAVWTLALAANAPMEPYFDFILYDGTPSSSSQLKEHLQEGGTEAGAVVLREPLEGYLDHGDIIIQASFAGKTVPIDSEASWLAACREALVDKKTAVVTASILRKGTRLTKEIKVTNVGFSIKLDESRSESNQEGSRPGGLGLMLQAISEDEAKALGLPNTNGFLVLGIRQGSPAEKLKIKPDDILLALNGVDITNAAQLQELSKGPLASAKVFRSGAVLFLAAPLVI